MAHGRDKEHSRENRTKVREILMREWDPIGIAGCEGAEDEYDAYVGKVYVMLMDENATADAISTYLYDTSIGYIGLSPSDFLRDRARKAADALIAVRPMFDLH